MPSNLLSISNLTVAYGRLTAIRDVSLAVEAGSTTAVIGPNGAGKSTLLRAIAGGVRAMSGSIVFDGHPITTRTPEAIASIGISLIPEGRHVFSTLSIRENLLVGSYMLNDPKGSARDMERMLEAFPRLRGRLEQAAGKLSGGEQQMLVVARALMTRPRLLLIDEPSLGLAPKIVDEVYDLLLSLKASQGLTLLINEQTSKRTLRFADAIHVLRQGTVRLAGTAGQFREGSALSDAYFGSVEHHQPSMSEDPA
jgi:branched-chain amino acid transport system ATP-binding protein